MGGARQGTSCQGVAKVSFVQICCGGMLFLSPALALGLTLLGGFFKRLFSGIPGTQFGSNTFEFAF